MAYFYQFWFLAKSCVDTNPISAAKNALTKRTQNNTPRNKQITGLAIVGDWDAVNVPRALNGSCRTFTRSTGEPYMASNKRYSQNPKYRPDSAQALKKKDWILQPAHTCKSDAHARISTHLRPSRSPARAPIPPRLGSHSAQPSPHCYLKRR